MKRIALFVLGCLTLLNGNAQSTEDLLPPEVKSLIGVKLSPKASGMANTPSGWEQIGTFPIDISPQPTTDFVVAELYKHQGNKRIFAIVLIDHKDRSEMMLDAKVLPGNFLADEIIDGKPVIKKHMSQMFYLTNRCERGKPEEKIIGLWRPEPGAKCNASSTLVKKAWLVNKGNGRLTDIPSKGVSCRDVADGDCD